jgi:DNA (cytosine-5)-methyltransferase 1
LNYLDLFSGIGGFALGAQRAGFHFDYHFNSDISEYANKVYAKRFPEAIQLGDITKIKTEDLPNGEWIITGGFPCQDISVAGNKKGLNGKRSGLWFEMQRIVKDIRPEYCIIENVGRLTGNGLETILKFFDEIGYSVAWKNICAWEYGAPHRRERIYIIADSSSERFKLWCGDWEERLIQKNKERSIAKGEQEWNGRKYRVSKTFQVDDWKRITSDICGVDDGLPIEMDRLKCLGNSIVSKIAEDIFSMIKYSLESEPRKTS